MAPLIHTEKPCTQPHGSLQVPWYGASMGYLCYKQRAMEHLMLIVLDTLDYITVTTNVAVTAAVPELVPHPPPTPRSLHHI